MRFLVDENVDVGLISFLRRLRHDARRVPSGAGNGFVFALAGKESRILITHDSNFSNSERYPPEKSAGIIWLKIEPRDLGLIQRALAKLLLRIFSHRQFAEKLWIVGAGEFESMP